MARPIRCTLGLLSFLFLAACSSPGTVGPPALTPTTTPPVVVPIPPTATLPVVDTPTSPPSPTPGSPTLPDPQYTLTATLNYNAHHLAVEQEIVYYNRSPEPLNDLALIVQPKYYGPGLFTLKSLKWENGQDISPYSWDEKVPRFLRFPLEEPLPNGGRLAISLSYDLDLPSPQPTEGIRPVPFGYTDVQTNLVDWYPFIPPFIQGQGWILNEAWYFGEHLAYETSDFQVSLRLENSPDLAVAASAPEHKDGEWRRYQLEDARAFALSASPNYVIASETAGTVTLIGYSLPFDSAAGEAALQTATEALILYSQLFGPYPYQTLSVVEADFLDGMEYSGLFFLSKGFYNTHNGSPASYLIAIAAHETAHQWWYDLVGNDQAKEPWLDEALCTYSEGIYYERLHPESLDWWWAYRIQFYQPRGWVDSSIYVDGYRTYRDAVYLNGAVFLDELRKLVGDPAFFSSLKSYAERYTHQLSVSEDFFAVLKEHSSADLSPLLSKYFQSIQLP